MGGGGHSAGTRVEVTFVTPRQQITAKSFPKFSALYLPFFLISERKPQTLSQLVRCKDQEDPLKIQHPPPHRSPSQAPLLFVPFLSSCPSSPTALTVCQALSWAHGVHSYNPHNYPEVSIGVHYR